MPESSGSANAKIPASNAPKPATSAIWDVFISYASADTTTAHAIVATLESHGIRCWISPRDVTPGALYADEIVRAINEVRSWY